MQPFYFTADDLFFYFFSYSTLVLTFALAIKLKLWYSMQNSLSSYSGIFVGQS